MSGTCIGLPVNFHRFSKSLNILSRSRVWTSQKRGVRYLQPCDCEFPLICKDFEDFLSRSRFWTSQKRGVRCLHRCACEFSLIFTRPWRHLGEDCGRGGWSGPLAGILGLLDMWRSEAHWNATGLSEKRWNAKKFTTVFSDIHSDIQRYSQRYSAIFTAIFTDIQKNASDIHKRVRV